MAEFSNPLLLSVKMFLSDFTWIRRGEYKQPYHVCTHFAKETIEAAADIEMKCACVIVSFHNKQVRHAIVAFETDYGLKYFEPQTGEDEYLEIGNKYPSRLAGNEVEDGENIISSIGLLWNDKPFNWIECNECGYTLPTKNELDYCLHCKSGNVRVGKNNVDFFI